jgi:ribonucleoside-diphosphate reductase alpha chain
MNKALQEYIFTSKYARYLPEKNRRETYPEAVKRVMDMHRTKFAHVPEVMQYIDQVQIAMEKKQVLGSQRAMQFGGAPILASNSRCYNCTSSYANRPRFFQEAMWLLLSGCGVGFSVQFQHINQLPKLGVPNQDDKIEWTIEDSIEGWADALGALLSSYFVAEQPFPWVAGKNVCFDYTSIRAKGEMLSSGSRAPGYKPLMRSLELVRAVLDRRAQVGYLRPIDAYDIVMHASDAVLSGGSRRSATIAIFSPEDKEMAMAKTGNWFKDNPQRARSNNSAMLVRDTCTREQFGELMRSVREFGEPGFVFADSSEMVFNPCVEISMLPKLDGESGFAFCNLSEINMGLCDTEEKFYKACEDAAIIGTLQAAYTDFPYLTEVSKKIAEKEALLGVSMTGVMENPQISLNPEVLTKGAEIVKATNKKIAKLIGINQAARTTCVKPSGTASCLLGTSSGIHPHHAKRYFRRVQANDTDVVAAWYKRFNPKAVTTSVWNPNGTDLCITFLMTSKDTAKTKKDMDAIQLLEAVKLVKTYWVDAGKNTDLCMHPGLSHNVSNTISVKPSEWKLVEKYIFDNRNCFSGVSMLSATGDMDYVQAAFLEVDTPKELVAKYGTGVMFATQLVDMARHAYSDEKVPVYAATADVYNEANKSEAAIKFRQAFVEICTKHFMCDIDALTRCMKQVEACMEWDTIAANYTPVEYSDLLEKIDTTKVEETVACAGGACELV